MASHASGLESNGFLPANLSCYIVDDRFSEKTKGSWIKLHDDGMTATSYNPSTSHTWNTVYGHVAAKAGTTVWQIQILQDDSNAFNSWQMIIGISSTCDGGHTYLCAGSRKPERAVGWIQQTGQNTQSGEVYATPYRAGDVVSVVLDLDMRQLSFHKNGQDQGIFYGNVPPGSYHLAVSLGHSCQNVRLSRQVNGQMSRTFGIPSVDVPNLLQPLLSQINKLQEAISAEKSAFVRELQQDPVPQFTNAQVKEATQFLKWATHGMQAFIDLFHPDALETIDNEALEGLLDKSRESARKLALLLGDSHTKFKGDGMKGQVVKIQCSVQAEEVRQRLSSLQLFFDTFGEERWLGHVLASHDFKQQQDIVLSLLKGLLSPSKAIFENAGGCTPVLNPLVASEASVVEATSISQQVLDLAAMCTQLSSIIEEDGCKKTAQKEQLLVKMSDLNDFAEALNCVPDVLKKYVLIRLAEIDATDLTVLKIWITHDEATEVHRMLDKFRDEANFVRGLRAAAALLQKKRSDDRSSLPDSDADFCTKEYLFIKSVGQAHGVESPDKEHEEEQDKAVLESSSDKEAESMAPQDDANIDIPEGVCDKGKRKPSHHQRKRREKFWASVPRTPSSGTCQS